MHQLVTSQNAKANIKTLRGLKITEEFLFILGDETTSDELAKEVMSVLAAVVKVHMTDTDLQRVNCTTAQEILMQLALDWSVFTLHIRPAHDCERGKGIRRPARH